jgi:hypothetical protein
MNDCCDKLASCYTVPLERFYQLKPRLELIRVWEEKFIVYYRCKICSQLWEEHTDPFSRFELYSVLKSFPDENGKPRELYYDFHNDEATFLDTNEKVIFERKEPDSPGCLRFWPR